MRTIDIHVPQALRRAADARQEWHGFRHEPGEGVGVFVGGGKRHGFVSPKVRFTPEERLQDMDALVHECSRTREADTPGRDRRASTGGRGRRSPLSNRLGHGELVAREAKERAEYAQSPFGNQAQAKDGDWAYLIEMQRRYHSLKSDREKIKKYVETLPKEEKRSSANRLDRPNQSTRRPIPNSH